MLDWAERSQKQQVREWVFEHIKEPLTQIFTLPAREALCIKTGLDKGAIGLSTRIFVCDSNFDTVNAALQNIGKMAHWVHYETGFPSLFEKTRLRKSVSLDFLWLDLCGWWTNDRQAWLANAAKYHIADDATLAITFDNSGAHGAPSPWAGDIQRIGKALHSAGYSFIPYYCEYKDSRAMLTVKWVLRRKKMRAH